MKRFFVIITMLLVGTLGLLAQSSAIYFTENKHQWNDNVLFRSELYKGFLFAEKTCLTYYFLDEKNSQNRHGSVAYNQEQLDESRKKFEETGEQTIFSHELERPDSLKAHAYQVAFSGMNSRVKIYGVGETPYRENYFHGSNPRRWATNVRSFEGVMYENLYKNIDLHLYGNFDNLKYDFVVRPGGNPEKIKLNYSYVSSIKVRHDGVLVISTSVNEVYEQKPFAYQIIGKDTVEVPCSYHLEYFTISYDLGDYNHDYALYIDPDLVFSTYTGSTSDNWGFTATYDSENNVYLGGIVEGFGYPVSMGAIQTEYAGGNWDIGLIKFDGTGRKRLYATYLGGESCEMPHSLIVNSKNELLVLGTTGSFDFPTANALQPNFMGGDSILYDNTIMFEHGVDIFISRISADGSSLLASTFLGGTKNDGINFSWETDLEYGHDSLYYNYGDGARGEVMIDDEGNIYIASTTFSEDFPIVNGFQTSSGGSQDGVVCKFDPDLTNILWSSYIGGESKDAAYSIDVDHDGNAFVTGGTCSNNFNFDVTGYQKNRVGGTVDAYVLKLSQADGSLLGSSYFGSTVYDQAHFVRVNSEGNVFLFGQTTAPGNTLIYNAEYNTPNSGQFLASFNNDLTELRWSTVFGSGSGTPNISPTAFEVDICNRIYLAGVGREWNDNPQWYYYGNQYTLLYDYGWLSINGTKGMDITDDAYQKETDGKDFYIMVIDDEATNLDYATYFGEIANGSVIYTPSDGYIYYGCANGGRDHVDGGTSRFDANGFIYQSVCASCGGCNGFPIYPNPGVWSTKNNSSNCNSAVLRFVIDFGLITADFDLPEVGCASKELTFKNTTEIHYNNPHVTYLWDFGDGTTSTDESPVHTYAKNGTYKIILYVKDSTSCNQQDSVWKELTISTKVNYETLDVQNICLGDSVLVGIPNEYDETLEYEWSPKEWLTDPSQPHTYTSPNDTTTYQLTVTSGWCQTVYEQTVNVFNENYFVKQIDVTQNNQHQVPKICRGETIRLSAQTNAPSQRYLWSTDVNFSKIINPDFSVDYVDVTPTETTTYYVKTLSTYCEFEANDSIIVEVYHNDISVFGDTLICKGDIVPVSVKNLNPENDLSYQWTPKTFVNTGENKETAFVKPTKTTDFIVFATDAIGCRYSDTVHIQVDELDLLIENFQPISCYGKIDAQFEISPIGIEPYSYVWEDGSTFFGRYGLGQGVYKVVVTDGLGCENSQEIEIIEPKELKITEISSSNETCKGACNGTIRSNVIGGTEPYTYEWSNGDSTSMITNLCPNNYTLKVVDSHGCTDEIENSIRIILEEKLPDVDAYAERNLVYLGQSTKIYATRHPSDTIQYIWTPGIWLDDYHKPVTTLTPDIPLKVTFNVLAIDQYGCQNSDTIQIESVEWICGNPFIFVPSAFTPNGDGKNDEIQVHSGVITALEFAIFDRWGEKIFETTDYNESWDGTYNGKPLQPQVFVYYLKATCINEEIYEEKGNITLIR